MKARVLVLLAASFVSGAALADVFRCTERGGRVTYQEIPCPTDNAERVIALPEQFPEVNREARERLFQREAALEARQLEREKMDTALRIAREERLAREAESRAQQPVPDVAPLYYVVQPMRVLRAPRHHHRPRAHDRPL